MKPLSKIAQGIAPSATLAITAMANKMKADGYDVVSFGAGEPDFNTPDYIKTAGKAAIDENKTRYTPAAGIMPLREAVCRQLERDLGLKYEPSQIVISSGAKHSIFIALQSIVNPGDEVILPAPYWVTYEEAIKMAGGIPVIIDTNESTNFKITPEMLKKAVSDKTKCVIFNNPSNPTGMLYTKEELMPLKDIIVENDIYVISDEIYFALTYDKQFVSLAALGENIKERTIIINGVSKTYAMTGWRVGYTAANSQIAKVMGNFQSHSTGAPGTMNMWAAAAAYDGDQTEVLKMKAAFKERRDYFCDRMEKIDGVSCLKPDGAFYILMNIKEQLGKTFFGKKVESSSDFAASLLENAMVAVVPGEAFGAPGYIRWSYATSMENIKEGLDRLEKFLKGEKK